MRVVAPEPGLDVLVGVDGGVPVDDVDVLVPVGTGGEQVVGGADVEVVRVGVDDEDRAVATGCDELLDLALDGREVGEGREHHHVARDAALDVVLQHQQRLRGGAPDVAVEQARGAGPAHVVGGITDDRVADDDRVVDALADRRGRLAQDDLARGYGRGVLGLLVAGGEALVEALELHGVVGSLARARDGVLGDDGLVGDDHETNGRDGEHDREPARDDARDEHLGTVIVARAQKTPQDVARTTHLGEHGEQPLGTEGEGAGERDGQDLDPDGRGERLGPHEDDEGIVPEVDAIGVTSHPGERRQGEEPGEKPVGDEKGRDEDDGEQRREQHATVVEEGGLCGEKHHHGDERQEGDDAREVVAARGRGQGPLGPLPHGPRKGQPGAQEQRERTGVGAIVDAAGILARTVEHCHGDGRGEREHQGEDALQLAGTAVAVEQEHEHDGPDDAELRVDAQVPQVGGGRRCTKRVEVGHVAQDVAQVLEEPQRGQEVGAQLGEQHVVEDDAEHHHDEQHERHRRPDALEATEPEVADQLVGGRALALAARHGGGDDIARQHEEHDDAQMAGGKPGHLEVVEDDGEDRQDPQTVKLVHARARRAMRRGRRCPPDACHVYLVRAVVLDTQMIIGLT